MKLVIALAGLVLLGACATETAPKTASQPAKVAAARPVKAAGDPDARVCRDEIVTGSTFTKKTCHSRAEWDMLDKRNREGVRRTEDATRAVSGGN